MTPHRVPVFGRVGDRLICNFHARPMARSLAHGALGSDPKEREAWRCSRPCPNGTLSSTG
jgi:hypothetical protein